MDITPEMLERGREKVAGLGLQDRIELRIGDAEQIDCRYFNSVDRCCSAFMMRNLTDIRQSFREMLRVVKPGGRVVCLEISHPPGKMFGSLFHFYFYQLAPLFGSIIGKAFEEYDYLPHSLTDFPDAPTLKVMMEEVGWSDVRIYRLTGGIVVHVGTKRNDNTSKYSKHTRHRRVCSVFLCVIVLLEPTAHGNDNDHAEVVDLARAWSPY